MRYTKILKNGTYEISDPEKINSALYHLGEIKIMNWSEEKLLKWLDTQVRNERDKWESGLKNHYYEMEDLKTKIEKELRK